MITREMKPLETHIIGGMFGLEISALEETYRQGQEPPFLTRPYLLLATARSAFTLLARMLHPRTVWLPSFLCGVVIGAFPPDLIEIRFYPIDEQLGIIEEKWLSDIHTNDMVVFIDYFGFNQWTDWGAKIRHRGAWVIEDATQALLNTHFDENSHYVIFSPRKFVGVPDGGILMAMNEANLPNQNLVTPPVAWWIEAARASILRAEFDRHRGERIWYNIFQKTEADGPLEPYKMSDLSTLILKHAIDWQTVSQKRRVNYQFLASKLEQIAIFPKLTSEIVPLGFPIRIKERDCVRQSLFTNQIFPPVHWPIAGIVPSSFDASHRLAAEIMTIPCDQRYNQADMERVINKLSREIGL